MGGEDNFYNSGERGEKGKHERTRGVTVKITFL
jgi:hypothetical protein